MKILLQDKNALNKCFAEIDYAAFQKKLQKTKQCEDKIPPIIKIAIRQEDIPNLVYKLFEKHSSM